MNRNVARKKHYYKKQVVNKILQTNNTTIADRLFLELDLVYNNTTNKSFFHFYFHFYFPYLNLDKRQ